MSDFAVQKPMRTISLGFGSSFGSSCNKIDWLTQTLCFDFLTNQAKTKICVQTPCSLSLSLSLYFYDLPSKFANSLDPEDRQTCLIRGKQAYQELQSSPTLRLMITEHFRQVPSFRCMHGRIQRGGGGGGHGVRTPTPPWKITKI